MKRTIAIATLIAFAGSAYAQLNTLPPNATDPVGVGGDGITIVPTGGSNNANWNSALGAYHFASDGNLSDPHIVPPNWTSTRPADVGNLLSEMNTNGGTIRTIFLGESAGWHNDFGYSYSGAPADLANSFTVWRGIQALAPVSNPKFLDYFDLGFDIASVGSFDFWLNAVGGMPGQATPGPSQFGGVDTVFNPANSIPNQNHVRWLQSPIWADTYLEVLGHTVPVATYLVSLEDWNLDRGSDRDFNDLTIAFQFYLAEGSQFRPVPEPAAYGMIGTLALLGVASYRRFKRR